MTPERLGLVIGAVFGLIHVVVNAGELPSPAGPLLHVLGAGIAVLSALGLVVASAPARSCSAAACGAAPSSGADRRGRRRAHAVITATGRPGILPSMGPHSVHQIAADCIHAVWHNSIEPVLEVESGATVELEVTDASGGQLGRDSTVDAVACDLRIHEVVDVPNWVVGCFIPDLGEPERRSG
jgi:hypothetical protein